MFWCCLSFTLEPHQSYQTFPLRDSTVYEVWQGWMAWLLIMTSFKGLIHDVQKQTRKTALQRDYIWSDACLSTMTALLGFRLLIRWEHCYNTDTLSFTHFKEITAGQHASSGFKLFVYRCVSVHVADVYRQRGGAAWCHGISSQPTLLRWSWNSLAHTTTFHLMSATVSMM